MRRLQVAAVIVCIALVGVACTRDDSSNGSADSTTSSSTGDGSASSADFGTLKNVCQPGDAKGSPTQGVTGDSIRIATFSDRGFTGRPGLNQELFDSGEVFTKWCNDRGGINGRKILLDERDTMLTEYKPRVLESCRDDFFMVGGGAVFDNTGVKDRLQCMLPDLPGFVVTAKARESDLLLQPLPNPPGAVLIGDLRWFDKKFPESTQHVAFLTGDIPTTVKVSSDDAQAAKSLGWKTVYSDRYPAAGAPTWTPYVQAMKDKGVRGIMWTGEPEGLAKLEIAMADANFNVDWIRASTNHNDEGLIKVAGSALKNTYVWTGFVPFGDAKSSPALQKYLDLFAQYKPGAKTKASLGLQSFSAWLLFAVAARECGSDLTRTCVYDNVKKVHEWTAGGLHASTNPGANTSSGCYVLLEATPKGFLRADIDPNQGIYNCTPKNTFFIKGEPNEGIKLADVGKTMKDLK